MTDDLFEPEAPPSDEEAGASPPRLVLRVHLQPGAGASAVVGRNGSALALRVAPPPADPRAAVAAAHFLAELLSLAPDHVELVAATKGPTKRFRLIGVDADVLRRQLDEAIEQAARGRSGARGARGAR